MNEISTLYERTERGKLMSDKEQITAFAKSVSQGMQMLMDTVFDLAKRTLTAKELEEFVKVTNKRAQDDHHEEDKLINQILGKMKEDDS